MKKQVFFAVLAAASALGGMNVAQAQGDAECLASGRCGHTAREQGLDANGNFDPRVYQREIDNGTAVRSPYANGPWHARAPSPADNRLGNNWRRGAATPYPRTSRDRDGDGVRNERDRYPDDPRYR